MKRCRINIKWMPGKKKHVSFFSYFSLYVVSTFFGKGIWILNVFWFKTMEQYPKIDSIDTRNTLFWKSIVFVENCMTHFLAISPLTSVTHLQRIILYNYCCWTIVKAFLSETGVFWSHSKIMQILFHTDTSFKQQRDMCVQECYFFTASCCIKGRLQR